MTFLIFESIGMSELIVIGIVALIVFGPRKLPQIARKAGKTMTDLRKVTNEFKETWQKEVEISELENVSSDKPISQVPQSSGDPKESIEMPLISTASPESFDAHRRSETKDSSVETLDYQEKKTENIENNSSKKEWF